MSESVYIGLYAREETVGEVASALIQRLLVRCRLQTITLQHKWDIGPEESFSLNLTESEWHSLVAEAVASENKLRLQGSYQLASGRSIILTVGVNGREFEQGHKRDTQGHISVGFTNNSLFNPVWEFLDDPRVPELPSGTEGWEDLSPGLRMELAGVLASVLADQEELFFRICDLLGAPARCASVEHAGIYVGASWISPLTSSGMFHRDATQFALDFVRIYREYNEGVRVPMTLDPRIDIWAAQPRRPFPSVSPMTPGKVHWPEGYLDFGTEGSDDILRFLNSLTDERARELAKLSGAEIRSLLLEMSQQQINSHQEMPHYVAVHDFGDCGLALITLPLRSSIAAGSPEFPSIWTAYAYIARRVL